MRLTWSAVLVVVMLSGAVAAGHQARGTAETSENCDGTRLIGGTAVDANTAPLPNAMVRLRNLQESAIEHVLTTDKVGRFQFVAKPDSPYVVEIVDQKGLTLAVSDVIVVQKCEDVAAVVVALASKAPAPATLFGVAGSVATAAAGIGLTVVAPNLPKLSPRE